MTVITPAHAFFNWAILRKWFRPPWVVAGSILPDLPSFAAFFYLLAAKGFPESSGEGFFGFVMANGNPNRQPGFMEASFLLNALPLYLLVGAIVLIWRRSWLLALWAGWGLHIVEDFLTHVIDAYAPLYPFFPDWKPRGVVSYWDPRYGGGLPGGATFGGRACFGLDRGKASLALQQGLPRPREREGARISGQRIRWEGCLIRRGPQ